MTTYLSLNGTSDYITFPSMTYTKILMNVTPILNGGYQTLYQDSKAENVRENSGDTGMLISVSAFKSNGAAITNLVSNTNYSNLEIDTSGTNPASGSFFSTTTGGNYMGASVYDIQFFNGSALVAHYDMSTGTINDQSGNGNNATLHGGTWLNDSSGQTTTYVGGGSIAASASLSSSSHVVLSDGKAISGNASLTVGEIFSYTSNGTLNGQSSLNSNEDMVYLASGTLQSVSNLGSGDSYIGASGTYYSGSGSILSSSLLTSSEIEKYSGSGFLTSFASLTGVEKRLTEEKGNILIASLLGANPVNVVFGVRGDILTNTSLLSGDLLNGVRGSEQFEDTGFLLMHIGLLSHENLIHLYIPHFPVGEIYLIGIQKNTISLQGKQKNTISLNGVMK